MPKPFQNIKIDNNLFQKIEDGVIKHKDVSGLVNIGNTCFMNSIIQCLRHNYKLSTYFISGIYKEDSFYLKILPELKNLQEKLNIIEIKDLTQKEREKIDLFRKKKLLNDILENWIEIIELMTHNNCILEPRKFNKQIQRAAYLLNKPIFMGFNQNDAQEFLQFLLENLHESLETTVTINIKGNILNKIDKIKYDAWKQFSNYFKNSYSIIIENYYGQFISIISNDFNDEVSYSYDPFCYLALELPEINNLTINDCLNHFATNEKINFKNEKCPTHTQFFKKTLFINLPEHLIIFFKRFNNKNSKINTKVNFPLELNMDKYLYIKNNNTNNIYSLYGICNHFGGTNGGHYTAFCKNLTQINNNPLWINYDDRKKQPININDYCNNNNNAYCLFYKKK